MFRIPRWTLLHAACVALLVLLPSYSSHLYAQNEPGSSAPDRAHIDEVLRGLGRAHGVGQVAISPDGKRLAWIEGGRGGAEIRLASPSDLTRSERVTAATKSDQHCRESELAWEPDS